MVAVIKETRQHYSDGQLIHALSYQSSSRLLASYYYKVWLVQARLREGWVQPHFSALLFHLEEVLQRVFRVGVGRRNLGLVCSTIIFHGDLDITLCLVHMP